MDDDRRIAKRYTVWFPMQLAAEGEVALAVSHNISVTGALLATAHAEMKVGDIVRIAFEVPNVGAVDVDGRVVRILPNEADPHGLWPYHIAIAFEEPKNELEATLAELEGRSSRVPKE